MGEEEKDVTLAEAFCEAKESLMAPLIDIYRGAMEMRQEFYNTIRLYKERKRIMSKNYHIIRRLPKNLRRKIMYQLIGGHGFLCNIQPVYNDRDSDKCDLNHVSVSFAFAFYPTSRIQNENNPIYSFCLDRNRYLYRIR